MWHGRRPSEASSHTDSVRLILAVHGRILITTLQLFSRASTSSTLVESTSDLSLYSSDEHVMLHLDYTLPIFPELSEPPSPSSPLSSSNASLPTLNDSAKDLILSPTSATPASNAKPRLWLHRRRRRTSSSDTRALLAALFHSRWPRSEPEDPIFGQTAPRALSPCRAQQLRGDETVTPSRVPTPRPQKVDAPALKAQQSPLKPCLVTPNKPLSSSSSSPSPATPAVKPRAASPPLKSCLISPSKPSSPQASSPEPSSPFPALRSPPISPSKARPSSPGVKARPSSPSPVPAAKPRLTNSPPAPRPHSTQSVPRSILRSDSRLGLGRTTPCSVTFAARAGVRVYATASASSSTLSLGSPADGAEPKSDAGRQKLNWYQRREKQHDWDAGSTVTYPPARVKKDSFLKRCFGSSGKKEKGPLVISSPMPLARAASLRDMRNIREDEARKEACGRENAGERRKLRKLPPLAGDEDGHAKEAQVTVGSGGRRRLWSRKTGV
ncbi:hypothetical protein K488DRAFT_84680 [Vararia minispora EC-137]|uniref:Uncharacterized protein n=1 Tax=Vararia minispora EC-137 TaxID=1314806 RepID=A0ACB8QPE1_9AGAM|nr:hypothetical protein K488DRAFT_84680 [Vararia minispora EC-137]